MAAAQPSGVITITTDFGHKGPFAAVMKGVILTRFAAAEIIDLVHNIPAHWPPEAGFWIVRAYRYFPEGTVHVAIVDPGPGGERKILLVEKDSHWFIAPDNGLLAPLLDAAGPSRVFRLDPARLAKYQISDPSPTFHGRDIYAPLAAEIAAGRLRPTDVADETSEWTPGWIDDPEKNVDRIDGIVITVDPFGNLITNIDEHLLADFSQAVVHVAGHSIEMMATYAKAQPGEYLALINSFGALEIARAEGSAAEGLGSERGAPVVVSEAGA